MRFVIQVSDKRMEVVDHLLQIDTWNVTYFRDRYLVVVTFFIKLRNM